MLNKNKSVNVLYGVSSAREKLFAKLGIYTLYDLICHFPATFQNRGSTVKCDCAPNGEYASLILEVITPVTNTRIKSKSGRAMTVQKFVASDETGSVKVTCFNREFLSSSVKVGNKYRFYGIITGIAGLCSMSSPEIEPAGENN